MSQNDTTVNTTPMKARNTAAKQKFLQLGTIKHIDLTRSDDGPEISYSEVTITEWQPQERTY